MATTTNVYYYYYYHASGILREKMATPRWSSRLVVWEMLLLRVRVGGGMGGGQMECPAAVDVSESAALWLYGFFPSFPALSLTLHQLEDHQPFRLVHQEVGKKD